MELQCSFREVKQVERFIQTPYGEFSFSDMLKWLEGLIASNPNRPSVFISDSNFIKLVKGEGLATKAKGSNYFFATNMQKCSDMLMRLRRAGMHSQGSAS